MANLFFIHTPLQVMIAQMIIRQEHLTDNIMLQGYIGSNSHFLEIYKIMMAPEMWQSVVFFHHTSNWALISRKHLVRDCIRTKRYFKELKAIVQQYKIDTIYLGDMKNSSCWLAAGAFKRLGLKICFFEEGSGHYVMDTNYEVQGSWYDRLYAKVIDSIYYRPVYGIDFAETFYSKGFSLSSLPIDRRYSVVPFYHEPFDVILSGRPILSTDIEDLIKCEIDGLKNEPCRLLLTSTLYDNGINDDYTTFVDTIIRKVGSYQDKLPLVIKFHPREFPEVRSAIINALRLRGINFIEIGTYVNIPIEYYLQSLRVVEVVHFFCSTEFYNGYLFPKTQFTSMLSDYYNSCKLLGLKKLDYIENLMAMQSHVSDVSQTNYV